MKAIGLIGGMSWESTLEYYRIINEEVKARLGAKVKHEGFELWRALNVELWARELSV